MDCSLLESFVHGIFQVRILEWVVISFSNKYPCWHLITKDVTCRKCRGCGFDPWVRKIPMEEGMATHSSILAWKISWTEEPGGLQSMGSQRVRHD